MKKQINLQFSFGKLIKKLPALVLSVIVFLLFGCSSNNTKGLIIHGKMNPYGLSDIVYKDNTGAGLSIAKVKSGHTVQVIIENFNPFLYQTEDSSKTIAIGPVNNELKKQFLDLESMFLPGLGDDSLGNSLTSENVSTELEKLDLRIELKKEQLKKRGINDPEIFEKEKQDGYKTWLNANEVLERKGKELKELLLKFEKINSKLLQSDDFLEEINHRKMEPFLESKEIKGGLKETAESFLNKESDDLIMKSDFTKRGDSLWARAKSIYGQVESTNKDFGKAYQNYLEASNLVAVLDKYLPGKNPKEFNKTQFEKDIKAFEKAKTGFTENMKKTKEQFEKLNQKDWNFVFFKLWEAYHIVQKEPFTYTRSGIQAEKDEVEIKLTIFRKEGENKPQKIDAFNRRIPVFGGWKVKASEGVSGGYFFKNNGTFINKDSIVTPLKGNLPQPMITALLHFNYRSATSTSLGFHLGTGFTMEEDSKLNILMGATIELGRKENWNINLGLALAKMNTISKGLKLGDNLGSSDALVPTQRFWRPGIHAGISYRFNI